MLLHSFASIVLAGALVGNADPTPKNAEGFDIMAYLPDDPAQEINLEAAWVCRDLAVLLKIMDHQRALQENSKVGVAYYKKGVDLGQQLRVLLNIARGESSEPIPMAITAYSGPRGPGVQMLLRTQPGFLDRLGAAIKGEKPAPWIKFLRQSGDKVSIAIGDVVLEGDAKAEAVLRLSIRGERTPVVHRPGAKLFGEAMEKALADKNYIIFARSGGMLQKLLTVLSQDPMVRQIAQNVSAIAITSEYDGDRTYRQQVLLDVPMLGSMLPPQKADSTHADAMALWDRDTMSVFSLAIPKALLKPLMALGMSSTKGSNTPDTTAFLRIMETWQGRLAWADFGSPSDWALAADFGKEAAAAEAVKAVDRFVAAAMKEQGMSGIDAPAKEPFASKDTETFLHFRPHPLLQGYALANVDRNLVLSAATQRMRWLHDRFTAESKPLSEGFARTLTPTMRTFFERPAILQGYTLMPTAGAWMDWTIWQGSGFTKTLREELQKNDPSLVAFADLFGELPIVAYLGGFSLDMVYDFAFALAIDKNLLRIDFLSSEL